MDIKPKKSETKLKIIIYGNNIDFKSIDCLYDKKKCKLNEKTIMNFSYTEITHNLLQWIFLIVKNGNIENIINLMKDDYKNKYFHHVLLLYIDNQESQIEIIKKMHDKGSNIFFPFIFFISSNIKGKNDIIDFVGKNELEIDYRTLLFLPNPFDPIELLIILWKKCCYYNQIGNSITISNFYNFEFNISNNFHSFNYFVIGRAGVGKSTFINILCGDLVALERAGANVTVGIKRFKCLNAPLYLYDTEGFSSGKELGKTKKKIFDTLKELNKTKQTIHGIFYLFNGQSKRTFDDKEEELINELFSKGIDIYFLLNFIPKKKNNSKTKGIFIEENQLRFKNREYNKLFEKNLFLMNLKNEDFECHGLDKVFESIYEKYKKDKIIIEEVKKLKGDNAKISTLLKQSSFFKNIKSSKMLGDLEACNKGIDFFNEFKNKLQNSNNYSLI